MPKRKSISARLKLSRDEQRYLNHFWNGTEFLLSQPVLDCETIFELFRVSREAFDDLVKFVTLSDFPEHLVKKDRERLKAEGQRQGELRWGPLPWGGAQILEMTGRESGPWLGEFMRDLEMDWACGKVSTLTQLEERLTSLG